MKSKYLGPPDTDWSKVPKLVPLPESGALIGVSANATYAARKRGEFPVPVFRVSGRYVCRRADLMRFVEGDAAVDDSPPSGNGRSPAA